MLVTKTLVTFTNMRKLITSLVLFFAVVVANAQYFDKQNAWKKQRYEAVASIGLGNYLGDLGGGSGGSRPWLLDMEWSQFKFSWGAGLRYNLKRHWAAKASFNWVKISGSDALTSNPERNYRNLSFKSNIYEVSLVAEYFILRGKPGHLYNIKGAKGMRELPFDVMAHIGVGWFYFKSTADGIPLAPLTTEGQGMENGPAPYAQTSFSFPFGIGANYLLYPNLKIGIDLSYRFTLTDYLDDASTSYYDNETLRATKGDLSADYADRTSGENPSWSAAGSPRGNANNKDHFLTASVTVTYNVSKLFKKSARPGGRHSFNKRRRKARF